MHTLLMPYPMMKNSGVKWLGQVPEHWKVLPNRVFFEEVNERDHPEEQMLSVTISKGVIRQQALLTDSSKKDGSNQDKTAYKFIRPGDVVYNKMRAWQGAFGVSAYQGIVSPAYVIERPRKGVNSRYFHYLLRTPAFVKEVERWSYGIASDMWSLRPEHFKMIYGCLPPFSEQTAIVRYLDHFSKRMNRYIRAKRRLVMLLEEKRKKATLEAILHQNTRSYRLDVVAKLVKRPVKRESDRMYIPIGLYNRGRGIFRKKPRSANNLGDSSFFWVKESDLVISGQFAWEGAIALASKFESGCVASHRYPVLRGNADILDSRFLLAFFQTNWGQLLLDSNSRGAAGRNKPLNAKALMKEKIPLPPLQYQLQISEMLQQETLVRQQFKVLNNLLNEYRARIVADVVTGKLNVREATAALPEHDPLETEESLADALDEETEFSVDELDEIPAEIEE